MNHRAAHLAIFKRFIDAWKVAHADIPYSVDNQKVPEPADGKLARVSIISGTAQIYTLGPTGQQQRPGFIDVRLSDKPNTGRGVMDDMITDVLSIFERKRFGQDPSTGEFGVVTYATSPNEQYSDKEFPQLWVVRLLTPFEFYS